MAIVCRTRLFSLLLFVVLLFSFSGCANTSQSEADYKKEATFIEDVENFAKQPDAFKGKKIQTVLTVFNAVTKGKDVTVYAAQNLMNVQSGTIFMLHYTLKDGESPLKNGDLIRFFGEYKQTADSKEAVPGQTVRVLECDAQYIIHPMWQPLAVSSLHTATVNVANEQGNTTLEVHFGHGKFLADGIELPKGTLSIRETRLGYGMFDPIPFQGKILDDGNGSFTAENGASFSVTIEQNKQGKWTTNEATTLQTHGGKTLENLEGKVMTRTIPAGTYEMKL